MTLFTTTPGILLSKQDWREADRLYYVFTRRYGKLELLGRGARKPLAKLASHLEFICEADFFIVHGKIFETLAGIERQTCFPHIYSDSSKMLLAHQSLSFLNFLLKPKQTDEELYDLLCSWLSFLNECFLPPQQSNFFFVSFLVVLVSLLGHRPELFRCLSCQKKIQSQHYAWHSLRGGVVCQTCLQTVPDEWFCARPVEEETIKLLRFVTSHPFLDWPYLRVPEKILFDFYEIVESFLLVHTPFVPSVSLAKIIAFS